uniref:DnaJ heat shock protein family (Hsp40) member C8 n=1 Tax=Cyanistes caeruleus TaxID=156563 RepID=A0A8C0UT04_CYACU
MILSHFPHTTALENLAGYFLNRKVVAGDGNLAGSGHSSLNSAFLIVYFILGVLQMDPEATDEEIKKRFRQLSILVHPDKNQDDADRAQKAFEGNTLSGLLWVSSCRFLVLFKQAVYKQTMKLFAELEIKRKEREAKEMHERKRQREEEIEAQEKAKREREWQKNFEESRDGRVDSWRNFQANTKGKKEKKNRTFLRPPKVKMEQRE